MNNTNDIIIAQGSFENVLKRIGSNKSKLLCMGTDPLSKSGVIVSHGLVVSSRILDITITPSINNIISTDKDRYLNKVSITYLDTTDKQVRQTTFDILNEEALTALVHNLIKIDNVLEKQQKIDEKLQIIDEKLQKSEQILTKNNAEIDTIGTKLNEHLNGPKTTINYEPVFDKEFNKLQITNKNNDEIKEETLYILDKDKFNLFKTHVFEHIHLLEHKIQELEKHIMFK